MKTLFIFCILSVIPFLSFSVENDKKWQNNIGFQFHAGYNHYYEKDVLKPYKTFDKILIHCISFETYIVYRYYLDRNIILKPFIGYSRLIDNTWAENTSINLYTKFITNCLSAGSFIDYQLSNFCVGIGVSGKRIGNRAMSNFKVSGYSNLELETKTFFQVHGELGYSTDCFSCGFVFNKGISYVSLRVATNNEFSFNEYLVSFTIYPVKCYNTIYKQEN
ncbi:MAG: hypothetical protein AB9842_03110 [Bacteroidales bacterium]